MNNAEFEKLFQLFLQYPLISTDTRKILPNSIYFALKGENFDGNSFAKEALKNGAVYAIIDNKEYKCNENIIVVDNVLHTLQELATQYRKFLQIPFIGITGTNGKTTTKELTHAVLSRKFKTIATQGNLNNHIGVPLTILGIPKETEMAIIEMGANHVGEIETLCNIANPDFGIITNVGKAHLEGFGSFENIIKTKTELYRSIKNTGKFIFVNSNNNILLDNSKDIHTVLYGGLKDKVFGKVINTFPYLSVELNIVGHIISINSKLVGTYNLDNIVTAAAIGSYFGVSVDDIQFALENYNPTNNRSQIIKTQTNTLIMDAYNANPTSMMAALQSFNEYKADNKVVILGDMLELGDESIEEHKKIMAYANSCCFDKIYFIGNIFEQIYNSDNTFNNSSDLKEYLQNNKLLNKNILIKGSRGIKLEKVLDVL